MLSFLLAAGIFLAASQLSETPEVNPPKSFAKAMSDGDISPDPAEWNDEIRKEILGNMPAEYHERYLAAYAKLSDAIVTFKMTRVKLFGANVSVELTEKNIRRHATFFLEQTVLKFHHYPAMRDPEKQAEYWNALAENTLLLYEKITEGYQRRAEEYKNPSAMPPGHRFAWDDLSGLVLPLTDAQKTRLLNDEPLWLGMSSHELLNHAEFPQFDTYEFLQTARDAEREKWHVGATPELAKLGIDQAEVDRWAGSFSLHPLIYAIADRCERINLAPLKITTGRTMGLGMPAQPIPQPARALLNTHPALLAVIKGEKDIAFSTRPLSQSELDEAEKQGVELVQVPFAKDAFVFLQNRNNPVRSLTLEQYQGIFSGKYLQERQEQWGDQVFNFKYQSWADVGGFGGTIEPFTRDRDSGSEELMQSLVMKGVAIPYQLSPMMIDGMTALYEHLAQSHGSIGYSVYYFDRYMMFDAYTRTMGVNGVFPNAETIASGKYPLVYECVLVHRKNPGENVERLVKWLLSDEGQKLVRSVGYVPVRE